MPEGSTGTLPSSPPEKLNVPAPAGRSDAEQHASRGGSPGSKRRLAWLDALRGLAALCVVYEHFGARVLAGVHAVVFRVFDPGLYGVLVFFLISGYIVPASLEKRGSVRTFWIGRLFRLFPLFALVIGVTLVLNVFGIVNLGKASEYPVTTLLSHLFMLNELLGSTNLVVVIWTLSYEMVFYLLLTALFTSGMHRLSCTYGVIFAAGALLLGGLLPMSWLTYHTIGTAKVALIADVLTIGGVATAMATRGLAQVLGAWIAAATGLVLVVLNERKSAYEGLAILALMFTGTIFYRAQHGQISRKRAAAAVAGIFAAVIAAGAWHIPALDAASQAAQQQQHVWVTSVALAGLTFGAGLALQNLRVPRAMAWLGLVSYSVYLTFPLLLDGYDKIPFPQSFYHQPLLEIAVSLAFLAALLACCAMTYYLVEAPMQRAGRRVAARLDARCRQSAVAGAVAATSAVCGVRAAAQRL